MHAMTPAPVESKLPVINAVDESDRKLPMPMAVKVTSVAVGGVGDGVSRPTAGSPLRRPKEMTRSMPEAPTRCRGEMEEDELDEEMAELSKLRCTSLQTEEIAKREREKKERQARRNNRYTVQIAKGAFIYDVFSGWGKGGPPKADERNKIS